MIGQGDTVLTCTREGFGWASGRSSSRKSDWALEWDAQGDGGVMVLGSIKEKTVCGTHNCGLVDKAVLSHRLDSMTSKAFSKLVDSVIL